MGLMVDTNVFIKFEKAGKAIDLSPWEASEKVFISVVTVSELLMGVHRADTDERRQRRSLFVEAVISGLGVLDFTVAVARLHAEICADLAKKGQLIGAHDLIIAATARCHDLSLLTNNVDEFSRVPGLRASRRLDRTPQARPGQSGDVGHQRPMRGRGCVCRL